jgi:hypothetical protein
MGNNVPVRDRSLDAGIVRLNVNLNAETAAALRRVAEERGISATETVRRAVALLDYLEAEKQQGRRIFTGNDGDQAMRELVLM